MTKKFWGDDTMHHHNGTGLHPYWYIRLISLVLTVFLPLGTVMYLNDYHPEILTKYMSDWIIFAWVILMILVLIISLKIESILEKKKRKRTTVIGNINMTDEQNRAFNKIFGQVNITFENENAFTNPNDKAIILCPKCHSNTVARTQSGKYICLTCEHQFY